MGNKRQGVVSIGFYTALVWRFALKNTEIPQRASGAGFRRYPESAKARIPSPTHLSGKHGIRFVSELRAQNRKRP